MEDAAGLHSHDPKLVSLVARVDAVLDKRTDRLLLVLERPLITENYLGCLRTAECLGIQRVWIVVQERGYKKAPPPPAASSSMSSSGEEGKKELKEFRARVRLSRSSAQWLDMREFATTSECIEELMKEKYEIWSTDLGDRSVSLMSSDLQLAPEKKVAIVMGREADGVTSEMLEASHKRVYLPLFGWNTSLNLQVATGMVLQQLLNLMAKSAGGERVGDLSAERKAELRMRWLQTLSEGCKGREGLLNIAGGREEPGAG